MEELANKGLMEEYKEQKKQLDRLIALLGFLYLMYSKEDGLYMTISEKNREMRKIEKELKEIYKHLSHYEVHNIYNILNKSYKETYYRVAHLLDSGIVGGIKYKSLNQKAIDGLIKNHEIEELTYSDRVWKNNDLLIGKLHEDFGQVIYDKKDVRVATEDIKDIFNSSAYQSKRLMHDQLSRILTSAMLTMYEDTEIVEKVIWMSVLDENTCSDCDILDGTIFDIDESFEEPPLHVWCRCTLAPYIEYSPIRNILFEDWLEEKNINVD